MRALFLVLLLANAAFFAWSQYYSPADAASDPAPLGRQIEPEKLRIVAPDEPVSMGAPPAASPSSGAAIPPVACLEWGGFSAADAPRAEKAIEPLALGERLVMRQADQAAGWWVFVPPQGTRQGAQRKAGELKALGVEDYFIVQEDGPLRWALSLGVFRTEEAAQAHLARLQSRGVRQAQVGARETPAPKVWLQIRGADAPLQARLQDLAGGIDGSVLRECRDG